MTTQRTTAATTRRATSRIPSEGPTCEQQVVVQDEQAADQKDRERCQSWLGFSIEQCVTTGVATISSKENEMTSTPQIPATQNDAWGFFGTMNEKTSAAWPLAMTAISDATGQPLESVRIFLDSCHGRHFADYVLNQLHAGHALADAINVATQQWMGWKIGSLTSRDYGIPRGLPYLTGFVIHYEIAEESLAA